MPIVMQLNKSATPKIYASIFQLEPQAAYPMVISTRVNLLTVQGLGEFPHNHLLTLGGQAKRKLFIIRRKYDRGSDIFSVWFIVRKIQGDPPSLREEGELEAERIFGLGDLVITIETDDGPDQRSISNVPVVAP